MGVTTEKERELGFVFFSDFLILILSIYSVATLGLVGLSLIF